MRNWLITLMILTGVLQMILSILILKGKETQKIIDASTVISFLLAIFCFVLCIIYIKISNTQKDS